MFINETSQVRIVIEGKEEEISRVFNLMREHRLYCDCFLYSDYEKIDALFQQKTWDKLKIIINV